MHSQTKQMNYDKFKDLEYKHSLIDSEKSEVDDVVNFKKSNLNKQNDKQH